ncbi:MAG: hypothetical protein H6Q26_2504, partial [Bacteroidetes bacterium]|nr:hypothetical protein [Bacteroidota bacterium]
LPWSLLVMQLVQEKTGHIYIVLNGNTHSEQVKH